MSVVISETTNVDEIINEAYPFSVDKFPLQGVDGLKTPLYGLFRSDRTGNDAFVGNSSFKKGYLPHNNSDVATLAEAAVDSFEGECALTCDWKHGHVVTIAPPDKYRKTIGNAKDKVFPAMVIEASYDGRAFKATLGLYRDLCSNLMLLRSADESNFTFSIQHRKSMRSRLAWYTQSFRLLSERSGNLVDIAKQMQSVRIDPLESLDLLMPKPDKETSRSRTIRQNKIRAILRRLNREKRQLGDNRTSNRVNGWLFYNAVQGYFQHETNRKESNLLNGIKTFSHNITCAANDLVMAAV